MLSSAGPTIVPSASSDRRVEPLTRGAWWLTLVALICGLWLLVSSTWVVVSHSRRAITFNGSRRWIIIGWVLGLALLSLIPLFRQGVLGALSRLRGVTPSGRRLTMGVIFVLSTGYLLLTARLQGRDFTMNIQDEMMYLVQAQMLAHGHLYLPAHPMADFFQELFIFHKPVYASMYFPGTALFYVPSIWLHVPNWLWSALVSGAAVAMTYRVLAEALDGASAVLGAMLLVSCGTFRLTSIMVMSHPLTLLFGLLMFWSYLNWRVQRRVRWIVCFGFFAGWAAITRPIDAIAWCLPPLICIFVGFWRRPRREMLIALIVMGAAAAPFLSLQFIFDKGVTGKWFETPVQAYHHQNFPGMFTTPEQAQAMGHPQALQQFRDYNERYVIAGAQRYEHEQLMMRFGFAFTHTLPATWLLFFVPLGIVALRGKLQWALAGVFLTFVLGYMTFMFFAAHYLVVLMPIGLFLALLGARQLERWVGPGAGPYVAPFLTLVLAGTAVGCLPEVLRLAYAPRMWRDEATISQALHVFNHSTATMDKPAVVFFHSRADNPQAWRHEQVYNIDSAWPDDAQIVRAQDLGDRNIELVNYYAQKQPKRVVYRYLQETQKLVRLGTVTEVRDHPDLLKYADPPPTTKPVSGGKKAGPDDDD
jgi:hypothetical protein